MKNPLSYQSTEYDCGPTTLMNAISYLYNREEIPPEIIKTIMLYCLDGFNKKGEAGKSGTTAMAVSFLSSWFNQYGKIKKFPIETEFLQPEEVVVSRDSKIGACLQQGGAVVSRVMLGCWHYVLLTGIDDEYVYLFDPYYRKNPFKEDGVDIIKDKPTSVNRRVKIDIINGTGKANYALGNKETRESLLLFNTNTRTTMENIEYFI
jgi:hypothetical protein